MKCLDCNGLLQRRLDGETIVSADLDAHLASCSECRHFMASSLRLLETVRHLPASKPPVGLSQRLTTLVLRERERRRSRFRWIVGVASLAASILVLALLSNLNRSQPDGPGGDNIVNKNNGLVAKETPGLNVTIDEVKNAFASLTERMTKTTKENAQILLTAANPLDQAPQPKSSEPSLDAYTRTVLDAGQGVGDYLQPVTQSAQRAVNYFSKGIPVSKVKSTH